MRHIPPALMLMATLAFQTPASAIPMTFDANLTGAAEIPPTTSTGTGFTTVVIDPAANTLHVDVTFSGLTTGTTASHIHCCVASGAPGNFIVATTTPTFLGFPLGVTSGTYDNTLDLTQASSFNPAFVTDEGGAMVRIVAGRVGHVEGPVRDVITKPEYLVVLEAGVALLVVQAIIINRLTGVRYPLWASLPAPKIGVLASRGALQRFTRFLWLG